VEFDREGLCSEFHSLFPSWSQQAFTVETHFDKLEPKNDILDVSWIIRALSLTNTGARRGDQ
jgi:hypothetical protein